MKKREDYNKIYDNGLAHIKAAMTLAENEKYGFAVSHLILGIEELIKYQVVLACISDGTTFSKVELKSVFRNHLAKLNLLKEFQEAISKEFPDLLAESEVLKIVGKDLEEKHKIVEQNRFKNVGGFLSVAYSQINIPAEEKEDFFNWLSDANNLKNRGFYVNDNFESPKDILKRDYEKGFRFAKAILKQTAIIKSLDITDDEFIEMMNAEVIVNKKNIPEV